MDKSLSLLTALIVCVPLLISPSSAVTTPDEFTIPLNLDVNFSNNLTVHLIQVTMSNITYYSTYSPDPLNTVWPVLVFQYENRGNYQTACRFHVQISDNTSKVPAGWNYDKTDNAIYTPLYPGKNSSLMTLEFAMPKDRILTNLSVIDDNLHKEVANIPIVYPNSAPSSSTTQEPQALIADDSLRNLLIIPIILVVVGLVGWYIAKTRLF